MNTIGVAQLTHQVKSGESSSGMNILSGKGNGFLFVRIKLLQKLLTGDYVINVYLYFRIAKLIPNQAFSVTHVTKAARGGYHPCDLKN